jgi:hypothetical protein
MESCQWCSQQERSGEGCWVHIQVRQGVVLFFIRVSTVMGKRNTGTSKTPVQCEGFEYGEYLRVKKIILFFFKKRRRLNN